MILLLLVLLLLLFLFLFLLLLLLLLLLLAAMTYNQVQSFQVNDYANYYVDIEITEYRALYNKNIAGKGLAISWLGTVESLDCINRIFGCYIRVYRSFSIFICRVTAQLLVGPTLGYALKWGTQKIILKI